MLGASGLAGSWPSTSGPKVTVPLIALAYGSSSSLAGLHRRPRDGCHGPPTRYPYAWPGPTPGTNACQMSASLSRSGIWVSAPSWSNRHNVTLSAMLEAIAKFVPVTPSCSPGVAPSGNGLPGSATVPWPSGTTRAPTAVAW